MAQASAGGDMDQKLREEIDRYVRRKDAMSSLRQEMGRARTWGLAQRHKHKEISMALRRFEPEPPLDDDDRKAAPTRERVRLPEKAEQIEDQKRIARVDECLRQADLNLRRLRHFAGARDALKLVRQAQNYVIDIEEDAN